MGAFVKRFVRRYAETNCAGWATSISWNALVSFVPIIVLLVTLLVVPLLLSAVLLTENTRFSVLPGAVFAGVALEVVTLLFPLYPKLTNSFATYGVIFAVVVLLVTYFYLVGQITVSGGLLNAELETRRNAR